MLTKEQILVEIKRTARENDNKPLGATLFARETGIKQYDWMKFWPRFSDALKDAGFSPNRPALEKIYTEEFLLEKIIGIIRKLNKFPTYSELFVEKNKNPDLPFRAIKKRLGTTNEIILKLLEYSQEKNYQDIIKICVPLVQNKIESGSLIDKYAENLGEVYLFKSGKYYKIGKTNDTVRRGNELKIQLPENLNLIHSIKTDDPSGVEAYWHKRFDQKRMNGEWFDLNFSDIKAFKRWRKIY